MEKFNLTKINKHYENADISDLGLDTAEIARKFHQSFDMYEVTPLVDLKNLSKEIGLKGFFVKDESYRFGLNAFKVLGASYAIANYIADKLGMDVKNLSYEKIKSPEIKEKLGDITFTTATDGNHGRAVAWTANKLNQKSKVFMPKGSSIERLENIRKENSDANIMQGNYDDCVRLAAKYAEEHGGALIQDTSWKGYEKTPRDILKGYMTMALEAHEALKEKEMIPTHIFIQAGVGSLASGITAFFRNVLKENQPKIIVVEPNKANCLYRTAKANDGKLHVVKGHLDSIMAGLNCGEPVTIGWPILENNVDYFISVDDIYTAAGMRILGNPLGGDRKVISGESGAVTSGVVYKLMTDKNLEDYKNILELDENSVVLCFSTEGDTDKRGYRDIVWDGDYPSKDLEVEND
ncbi:diaminopropionate ammonia-lyase [Peptoniphilus sp. MSJ-1]|uniref:Diaminopropionate ammonia-lyase n=1 Tax=Peptoniphilus ovalis TaxID=2841503 RepID=A0ABS6FF33_9FIRM|nr:diaminopropionate ammonia-lyase [Peptoniphilus ovalis]MBU5668780.1 diaminopropionate ammonia-lyase [Peptoniphilus ovalis]